LIGLAAPLALALFAIPVLLEGLGAARFGLLTLIWALVSYFGLFDLGLGRALTMQLAVVLERRADAEVGPLCGTALSLMWAVGVLAGLVLYVLAPWLLSFLRELPDMDDAVSGLRWLAIAMPFVIVTAGLRGALEASGAFGVVNGIRVPMGLWTFAGPLLVLTWFGPSLSAIAAVLAAGRLLGAIAHGFAVWYVLPQVRGRLAWCSNLIAALLRSGGWLLLSNVLGPLMGYADRFIVGMFVPLAALAHYATPQELVMKLWVLPGALTSVLFPELAARIARGEGEASRLCRQALLGLVLLLLPITLGLATFAEPMLAFWLGPEFASRASGCALVFSLGMFVTGLTQVPYTALQSAGKASTTAKLHLLELPVFVVAMVWAAANHGIVGASWVWLLRVLADALLLFAAAQRLPMQADLRLFDAKSIQLLAMASLCFLSLLLPSFLLRISAWLLVCGVCLLWTGQLLWRQSRTMRGIEMS